MARGDELTDHEEAGELATTDDSVTTLVSIGVVASDSAVMVEGWAIGIRTDSAADAYKAKVHGLFRRASSLSELVAEEDSHTPLDFGGSTYTVTLTSSGDNVLLQIKGAVGHTVSWYGQLKVKQVETATIVGG